MDALHFALTATNCNWGKIFCLAVIQSRVYPTGGKTSGKTLRVYLKNILTYKKSVTTKGSIMDELKREKKFYLI